MRLSPIAAFAAALAIVTAGCASAGASGPGLDATAQRRLVARRTRSRSSRASTDLSASAWHGLGGCAEAGERLDARSCRRRRATRWTSPCSRATRPSRFVQPTDEAKLAAFAKKHDLKTRTLGNWTAVARDDATLDAVANAKTHLADNARFVEAMSRLPGGALVRAYANGDEAGSLLASIPGSSSRGSSRRARSTGCGPTGPALRTAVGVGTEQFRWLAAALTSTSSGLKLEAFAPTDGLTASGPPRLAVRPIAPYTSGARRRDPRRRARGRRRPAAAGRVRAAAAAAAGADRSCSARTRSGSPNELDALLGGETALYVRPALPMPRSRS